MKNKHIIRCLSAMLLVGLLAGCTEQPMPTEVETEPMVTEPVVDTRTWAERTVQAYADYSGISYDAYPENMLALLEKNPETIGFVLRYPEEYGKTHEIDLREFEDSEGVPLFIQWDRRWGYIPYGSDVAAVTA